MAAAGESQPGASFGPASELSMGFTFISGWGGNQKDHGLQLIIIMFPIVRLTRFKPTVYKNSDNNSSNNHINKIVATTAATILANAYGV